MSPASSPFISDKATQDCELFNDSPFLLTYAIKPISRNFPENRNGAPVFSFMPATGDIEAKPLDPDTGAIQPSSVTTNISFRPHLPFEVFKEKFLFYVANQKQPTYLYLYGHCFAYQMYCIYDLKIKPFSTNLEPETQFTHATEREGEKGLIKESCGGDASKEAKNAVSNIENNPAPNIARGNTTYDGAQRKNFNLVI
jgi:hypothetical protein